MKILLLVLCMWVTAVQAQTIGYLRYDTVKIMKNGGTGSLDVTGNVRFTGLLAKSAGTDSVVVRDANGNLGTTAKGALFTTPTWQQTLTAGSTLTGNNTVDGGGFDFTWNNSNQIEFNSTLSTTIINTVGALQNYIYASNTNVGLVATNPGSHYSSLNVYKDSITIKPNSGTLFIDTLTNNIGTHAVRYNPTTGLVSYADTTSGGAGSYVPISDSSTLANPTGYLKGKDIVGDWISTTFPGASLPAGWANYLVSPTFSGGLVVAAGGGSTVCTNGFTYNTSYSNSLNYTTTMDFTLNTKPTLFTEGLFVGRRSANAVQQTQNAVIATYSDANNWRLVTDIFYGCTQTSVDSTATIPMADGNKYRIYIAGSNTNIFAKFSLLNTAGEDSVVTSSNYVYVVPATTLLQPANIGSEWIGALGSTGNFTITNIVTKHFEYKQSDVLFVGNSVGGRYDASILPNHYSYLSMANSNKTWNNLSGGGNTLVDLNAGVAEVININPKYVIIEAGINDPYTDIRAGLTTYIDALQAVNITPIFLKLFSATAKDTIVYNVCREQGVQLVDANTANEPLSTSDGTHPDDDGMQQITYILKSSCPLVTGTTGGSQLANPPLAVGSTLITGGTVGRPFFEGAGNVLQQSVNYFWNNTTARLSLRAGASPAAGLHVYTGDPADGIMNDGVNPAYINAIGGVVKAYSGTAASNGAYVNSSLQNDMFFRNEVSGARFLFAEGGVTNPSVVIHPTLGIGIGLAAAANPTTKLQVAGRFAAQQGADVASAAGAIALGTDGNSFEITGTNAITLISNVGWVNGSEVTLMFSAAASLVNATATSGTDITIILAGATNFVASADDTITLVLGEIGGVQAWREKCRSVN